MSLQADFCKKLGPACTPDWTAQLRPRVPMTDKPQRPDLRCWGGMLGVA